MKNISFFILIIMGSLSVQSFAQDHAHHAKHNMVLFGEADAYYASHIVYKEPHNFQVIIKVNFDSNVKAKIAREMHDFPGDQFIYLLGQMDISQISQKPGISGQIFRRATDGSKQVIFEQIDLKADEYSVIYFDELPLSLSNSEMLPTSGFFSLGKITPLQCAKDDQRPQCCRPISNCGYPRTLDRL